MKKRFFTVILVLFTVCIYAQDVSINVDGSVSNASAALDVDFSDKGILVPRMTTAQRNAISSPANGLMIYNTDCNAFSYYNGTAWVPFNSLDGSAPSVPGAISGNNSVCSGASGEVYSISAVSEATSYTWTTPTGSTITSGQGTSSITVTFGANAGDVCVSASNDCGTSSSSCQSITIGAEKTVFTTSLNYAPNLGGLAGANALCQTRATAAGLTGTYMAWLSDGTNSPSTTFTQATCSYKLVNGTVIASNWTDLTDGTLSAPINLDEFGVAPVINCAGVAVSVFTYTLVDGTPGGINGAHHCTNWTGGGGESTGEATRTDQGWTDFGSCGPPDCSESFKLYCFEQ